MNTIYKKDALKVEGAIVPSFYRAHVSTSLQYYKVAVPDIAIGDVVDYFLVVSGKGYTYGSSAQDLPPVITTLNENYPILKQKIDFTVDRGFYINFRSSNGAPELKKDADIDRNTYSYSLVDQDRPRVDDYRWLFEYRELPTIKFQVVFSKAGRDSEFFLGEIDEPKSSVTAAEIAQKVNYSLSHLSSISAIYVDPIKSRMRRDHGNLTNKTEIAKLAYYYFRNMAYSSLTLSYYRLDEDRYMSSRVFAQVMYELLKEYDIPCEVIVAPPRSISEVKEVVIADELDYCVKVGDLYLYTFNLNSNYNDPDPDLSGQAGYSVKVSKNENARTATPVTLPKTNATDNSSLVEVTVVVDENMENLTIQNNVSISGILKRSYEVARTGYDWEKDDYKGYGGTPPEEKKAVGNKSRIAEEERQKQEREEQEKKERMDNMKEFAKEDFENIVSYDEMELKSAGRFADENKLSYTEKFTAADLIKKVGPNYSVNIGSLIGGQVELEEKEKKRDYNVWLPYPRTLAYKVTFNIPAGYKAQGIEALNYNIDNVAGSFISTAKVEGQKIVVEVKKIYKTDFVKKEDWPKMTEFLDAAFNFTQKKVILSKAN